MDPGTSGSVARNSDHLTTEAVVISSTGQQIAAGAMTVSMYTMDNAIRSSVALEVSVETVWQLCTKRNDTLRENRRLIDIFVSGCFALSTSRYGINRFG
jgi:hypothetical protein